jgi:hypothetical protein
MIFFGSGKLIAVPTNLADGTAIANPTPVVLGILQECSLDMSVDTKTLYGSNMYPVAVAQGKAKIGMKAKYADISAGVMGSLFFGQNATNAIKDMALDVAGSIPATPFTVTPTVPSSGTFVADLGVFDATTGAQYTRVASAPATGQYSVNAATGVYTFAAADTLKAVTFNFEYSATSTTANLFTINNRQMGYTPSFSVMLKGSYDGKDIIAKFYRGVSSKLALPFKNEDFSVPDFEADFFANGAGNVGWICLK